MEPDLKAVEDAEVRLEARSLERRRLVERRDRRRRLLPWLLCPLPLPALGAAAFVALVEWRGGDLRDWTGAEAAIAVAAVLLVPAAVSAWLGRRHGPAAAPMWAAVTVGVELALVFGVGFAALGLGP